MNPKEKAAELIEKFKDYVHGYVGSSMLTNTEYPELIEKRAKKCAIINVDEMIWLANKMDGGFSFEKEIEFLKEVKKELTI